MINNYKGKIEMRKIDIVNLWYASKGDVDLLTEFHISDCNVDIPNDYIFEIYIRPLRNAFEIINANLNYFDCIKVCSSPKEIIEKASEILDRM